MEDAGWYKLKVTNEEGSVSIKVMVSAQESSTVKETVSEELTETLKITEEVYEEKKEMIKTELAKTPEQEPCEPKIEIAPKPVEFEEGETITLSCKVRGQH